MKKLGTLGVAVLLGMSMTLGLAPSASAYPEPVCNLVVSPTVVHPGDVVTVHCSLDVATSSRTSSASARAAANADTHWVVTFASSTRTGTGRSFTTHFRAPQVTAATVLSVHSVGTNTVAGVRCDRTSHVRDLPKSAVSPVHLSLPNTGGPRLFLLIAGLALVLIGGVAVQRSRHRYEPRH
jgi:LPXTG-motif cell wall-anchored protein